MVSEKCAYSFLLSQISSITKEGYNFESFTPEQGKIHIKENFNKLLQNKKLILDDLFYDNFNFSCKW